MPPTLPPPTLSPGTPLIRVAISRSLGLYPRFDHDEIRLTAPGGLTVWDAAHGTLVYTSAPGEPLTFRTTQIPGDSSDLWLWGESSARPADVTPVPSSVAGAGAGMVTGGGSTAGTPGRLLAGPFSSAGVYVASVRPDEPVTVLSLQRPASQPYPRYRGVMQLLPVPAQPSKQQSSQQPNLRANAPLPAAQVEQGSLWLINWLSLDEYLYSVVPIEMPSDFAPAALQAQAIAARTYALYQAQQAAAYQSNASARSPTTPIPAWADLGDSEAWQSYYGVSVEKASTTAAVQATSRQVVTYNGQVIPAFYSSTAGGHTESAGNVWGQPNRPGPTPPYLVGVPDDPSWGDFTSEERFRQFLDQSMGGSTSFDARSPYYRWRYEWPRQALEAQLFQVLRSLSTGNSGWVKGPPVPADPAALGTLIGLNVLQRGVSGRVLQLEVVTTAGRWQVWGDMNIRALLTPAGRSLLPSSALVIDFLPPPTDTMPPSAGTTPPSSPNLLNTPPPPISSTPPAVPPPTTTHATTPTSAATTTSASPATPPPASSASMPAPPAPTPASPGVNNGATPPSVPDAAASSGVSHASSPGPNTPASPAPPTTVIIRGTGYGHGVGLSQWGADGMARSGYSAPQIIAHYYPQTTLALVQPPAPGSNSPASYRYEPLPTPPVTANALASPPTPAQAST
ncbi:MAG: SpoIID/LytB domain-containing protein [Limnochordaceae bacterium]|nr:SpoIID/LytB domain-containing protein [Limnochordaceae bacterium]